MESYLSNSTHFFKTLLSAALHVRGAIKRPQAFRPDTPDLRALDKYYRERYSPRRKSAASNSMAATPRRRDAS
jgi:hypothetical protein